MSWVQDLGTAALRRLDAETAHGLAIRALKMGLGPRPDGLDDPVLAIELCGMKLPNCVGLAAGFDKNGEVAGALIQAGFGFVECGSVTPLPQAGNPRPRLFRLAEDRAVINRMGFNNAGVEAFAAQLARRPSGGYVGANLGANKESPDRTGDYVAGLKRLWGLADYFVVNISSPNTPGLRALQSETALDDLLGRLAEARASLPGHTPILLKVAPDIGQGEVRTIVDASARHGINGVIVSNTTIERPESLRSAHRDEAGGLSGAPLMRRSTEVLGWFNEANHAHLALIGVGGVATGADAYAKIRAGACAVQLYSALVYAGPGLVCRIKRDLAARLRADGFTSLTDAVGAR